jgi:hypothetical protein
MGNAGQQLESAANLQRLWEGLLPELSVPAPTQFLMWAGMCSEKVSAYAINRAARKSHRQALTCPMDTEGLSRYVTSIITNEREGKHRFTSSNSNTRITTGATI